MNFRILKMIATSDFLTALEYTKFVLSWSSASDLATSKGRGGEGKGKGMHMEGEGGEREGEWKGRRREGEKREGMGRDESHEGEGREGKGKGAVSYTHLTLPTIYSV